MAESKAVHCDGPLCGQTSLVPSGVKPASWFFVSTPEDTHPRRLDFCSIACVSRYFRPAVVDLTERTAVGTDPETGMAVFGDR